jgi:hypothetical protein
MPPPPPRPPGDLPFQDVSPNDWFYAAVRHVFQYDIMRGFNETTFGPDLGLTRAMVVTIIHRLEGEPQVPFRPVFTDISAGQWYSTAIVWAHDAGVVRGVGDGRFATGSEITREQLAAMMFRFAQRQGHIIYFPNPNTNAPPGTSYWAVEYMRWAHFRGFIEGTNPSHGTSRAETAVFIHRFHQRYGR